MALYDFSAPRLFLDCPLAAGEPVPLPPPQAHYVVSVMRRRDGDTLIVFNGVDGEWRGRVRENGRRAVFVVPGERVREQTPLPDLIWLFAPLKHARLDYMVQKAVEMGVGALAPVLTDYGQVRHLNLERVRANCIEAAEQCGVLALPEIRPPTPLEDALDALETDRLLVFCDENAPVADPLAALAARRGRFTRLALLIGPEGGFSDAERAMVGNRAEVVTLSLGPRILRADTAATAALALVQAALGDWT
ncbi:MAG: 16S rRNA (uracil(1498)-N(3))-methyltransferase [Methylobacteriaceae bacterium]|nr:16S rRNA (uracil(1498)-N(3))-methyltransferase [Methylobacteriaceae bacterium]